MTKRSVLNLTAYGVGGSAVLAAVYVLVVRPWHQAWGATNNERTAQMAGDELIKSPNWIVTRAVAINAPPIAVWPWLVQMGYRRGGLYSYDWLDQFFGVLDRPSADSVLPEFQQLSVGDAIPIANDPGWPVAAVEPDRRLVLNIQRPRLHITWSLLLAPAADDTTRLVLRYRGRIELRLIALPQYAFLDVAEFLMTRKMLLGIKARAERLASTGSRCREAV
jgi:hypothetical protein